MPVMGRKGPVLYPPSWALGSSWPEALAQEYCRPSGLVPVGGALLIIPQSWGCFLGLVLSLWPLFPYPRPFDPPHWENSFLRP